MYKEVEWQNTCTWDDEDDDYMYEGTAFGGGEPMVLSGMESIDINDTDARLSAHLDAHTFEYVRATLPDRQIVRLISSSRSNFVQ